MNIFLPIQIFLLVFLLFAFSRVILRFRDGTIPLGMFLFWVAIWILASFSIIQPNFTSFIAQRMGIGRGADAVIYASLIIVFYLNFRLTVSLENLRHEITKLTREIALKEKIRHANLKRRKS
ncbi:MAG: DUF2304 family protein [Candidatus Chisholmbacteria bacterium]|nr:DUF2304 family protein [Candidatus Chisholmbacteria bacterium]